MRSWVFRRKIELIILILPLLFLVGSIVEIIISPSYTQDDHRYSRFITSLFFLNGVHAFATFAVICTLPEFRSWISSTVSPSRWTFGVPTFWIQLLVVCTLIFATFTWVSYSFEPELVAIVSLLIVWFPIQHGLAQNFGISSAYNFKVRSDFVFSADEQSRAQRVEKLEKRAYKILLLTYSLHVLLKVRGRGLWHLDTKVLFPLLTFATTLAVINWLICAMKYPNVGGSNKIFYLLRLFLLPIAPNSLVAAAGLAACHGIEYVGVFDNLKKNTVGSSEVRTRLIQWTVVLCTIGAVSIIFRSSEGIIVDLYGVPVRNLPDWAKLVNNLSLTVAYAHYWVERETFKFRNPTIREKISPLVCFPDQQRKSAMRTAVRAAP